MHEFKKISGNHKNARAGICLTGSFSKEKNKNIIYNLKTQGLYIICTNLIYNLYKSDTFVHS